MACWGAAGQVPGCSWAPAPSHCPSQGQPIPGLWALPGDGAGLSHGLLAGVCGQLGSDAAGAHAAGSGAHMVSQAMGRGGSAGKRTRILRTVVPWNIPNVPIPKRKGGMRPSFFKNCK